MDVHNVFLRGDLSEEVYMKLPLNSFIILLQLQFAAFGTLSMVLDRPFVASFPNYSLIWKIVVTLFLLHLWRCFYLCSYLCQWYHYYWKDIPVASAWFKMYLSTSFHMKSLGFLKYFIGIEVTKNTSSIYILVKESMCLISFHKLGYLVLNQLLFWLSRIIIWPLMRVLSLHLLQYCRLIGHLIYLTITRSELAYSVYLLAQFMQQPRQRQWDVALRVFLYLKSCLDKEFFSVLLFP